MTTLTPGAEYLLGQWSKPPFVAKPAACPIWLEKLIHERCPRGYRPSKPNGKGVVIREGIDEVEATERAIEYLILAEPSIEHEGGNTHAYRVAARCKDFGVSESVCLDLMLGDWNEKCEPPWDADELSKVVANAYAYGVNEQGALSPSADFDVLPVPGERSVRDEPKEGAGSDATDVSDVPDEELVRHPVIELNKEFAWIRVGGKGRVLWQPKNTQLDDVVLLEEAAFHQMLASKVIQIQDDSGETKNKQLSRLWMISPERREYPLGIGFRPGKQLGTRTFNLWQGFAIKPVPDAIGRAVEEGDCDLIPAEAVWAAEAWFELVREQLCGGDEVEANWVIDWCAHMLQRPWEKPRVALVAIGGRGVGKNTVLYPLEKILGRHAYAISSGEQLFGRFNSHLQDKVLAVLDEAFWSGDKRHEGRLKTLITSDGITYERKGYDAEYRPSYIRCAILSNEEWVVPAGNDERRFAVYEMANGHQGDHEWFRRLYRGLMAHQRAGLRLLMWQLLNREITSDVKVAPDTEGLARQKIESLHGPDAFWFQCLCDGRVLGSVEDEWPAEIEVGTLYRLYEKWASKQPQWNRGRGGGAVPPISFGRSVREWIPGIERKRKMEDGKRFYYYEMPSLEAAKDYFRKIFGRIDFE